MPEFKVGDRVVAHKPEDVDEAPSWVDEMDECDGKELTVEGIWKSVYGTVFIDVKESFAAFNAKWLTHAEEFEGNV